jgi:hypothetical protein
MMKPSIHLNGSAPETLLEGYTEALRAVRDAIEKLAATAPHGRDYYTQVAGGASAAYYEALDEHETRMHKLADVEHEILELGRHVRGEIGKRQRK